MCINDFELYFTVNSFCNTVEDYLQTYYVSGNLVTWDNLPNTTYSPLVTSYSKFGTNPNDYKERYLEYNDTYYVTYYPTIFVWLGTANYVYQNSIRIVSYKDLLILAKDRYSSNFENKYLSNYEKKHDYSYKKWKHNRRRFNGRHYSYSRHSYGKNISKQALAIKDYQKEYPEYLKKTYKELNEYKFRNSYDFWDRRSKKSGNGWKENTRKTRQYLRHEKD